MKKSTSIVMLLLCFSIVAQAQYQFFNIWPDLAPGSEQLENKEQWVGSKEVSNVYQPELTVFLPEEQTGDRPAVIIFPGGGYRKIVLQKEGYKVAQWFNENGFVAFVLKYRLDRNDALRDAQRVVSLIRKDAEKYGVDENKIGVIGFSAGAHLAANLVMNHQNRKNYDETDLVSSRPDFWIGIYGVYGGIYGPGGRYRISDNIPPAFLVHAGDDDQVTSLGSVELYKDLKQKGIAAELHIYEHGKHGFALEQNRGEATTSTVNNWSKRCIEWLKLKGIN